jgi:GST-like protein
VMTRWRPKRAWFEDNTPSLAAIAKRAEAIPKLQSMWARNMPQPSIG